MLILFISQDGYFHTNVCCVQFLNNFFLPDLASPVIALLHIVSLVVSVIETVPDDAEHNKVHFVFISIYGAFCQTLL